VRWTAPFPGSDPCRDHHLQRLRPSFPHRPQSSTVIGENPIDGYSCHRNEWIRWQRRSQSEVWLDRARADIAQPVDAKAVNQDRIGPGRIGTGTLDSQRDLNHVTPQQGPAGLATLRSGAPWTFKLDQPFRVCGLIPGSSASATSRQSRQVHSIPGATSVQSARNIERAAGPLFQDQDLMRLNQRISVMGHVHLDRRPPSDQALRLSRQNRTQIQKHPGHHNLSPGKSSGACAERFLQSCHKLVAATRLASSWYIGCHIPGGQTDGARPVRQLSRKRLREVNAPDPASDRGSSGTAVRQTGRIQARLSNGENTPPPLHRDSGRVRREIIGLQIAISSVIGQGLDCTVQQRAVRSALHHRHWDSSCFRPRGASGRGGPFFGGGIFSGLESA